MKRFVVATGAVGCAIAIGALVGNSSITVSSASAGAEQQPYRLDQNGWIELKERLVELGMSPEHMPELDVARDAAMIYAPASEMHRDQLYHLMQKFSAKHHLDGNIYTYAQIMEQYDKKVIGQIDTVIDRCLGNFYYEEKKESNPNAIKSLGVSRAPSQPEPLESKLSERQRQQELAAMRWKYHRKDDINVDENYCRFVQGKPLIESQYPAQPNG